VGVERFPRILPFADFSFVHFHLCSAAKFFVVSSNLDGTSTLISEPHDQKGEGAARLAAAG
jgi:hypothetical protein